MGYLPLLPASSHPTTKPEYRYSFEELPPNGYSEQRTETSKIGKFSCIPSIIDKKAIYYVSENLRVRALATPVALVFGIRF
jgi:hypothetical protein